MDGSSVFDKITPQAFIVHRYNGSIMKNTSKYTSTAGLGWAGLGWAGLGLLGVGAGSRKHPPPPGRGVRNAEEA